MFSTADQNIIHALIKARFVALLDCFVRVVEQAVVRFARLRARIALGHRISGLSGIDNRQAAKLLHHLADHVIQQNCGLDQHVVGLGALLDCSLGGRVAPEYGAPVAVRAEVMALTEGTFVNQGPMQRGVEAQMGRSARLRIGLIDVIVTSKRLPVNDPGYFALLGVDVRAVKYLCVKAKNHFRAAFAPLCKGIVEVDTPGPAGIDLASMPYRHADKSALV